MPETLLRTKLYVPPLRPNLVPRPQLIDRLNQGLQLGHKLTLISAPAGFGKTTLVAEWLSKLAQADSITSTPPHPYTRSRGAWLSLDEGDNDPARFLTYVIAALNQAGEPVLSQDEASALSAVEGEAEGRESTIGKGALSMLQPPQPPPAESILTALLNEIAAIPDRFVLVLDDYHLVDAKPVEDALAYLLEHMPPQMHLVIATREDPDLPLARLRARGQLTELRAADLRFTSAEAAAFLYQAMSLDLSAEDVAELEARTEGWIAGLQLAALALQGLALHRQNSADGYKDSTELVRSFTGSHRFVLDYLIEEVLEQQSKSVQTFLLRTAILDRLTGPLCDALTGRQDGQQTLEHLEQANLFIIPLDDERRWYRYHHLFADLLRQRLRQGADSSTRNEEGTEAELHSRASQWYEDNGLEIEAFTHAAAANDIERAERLLEGGGTPLSFRGAVTPVLNWLASLPTAILDARPSLWVMYAMTILVTGDVVGAEEKLQAAEAALKGADLDDTARDLIGRIADTRGTLAISQRQAETLIVQSNRALEYLHPDNLTFRTSTTWKLGVAYEFQGDRAAAGKVYTEAISLSQASGNVYTQVLATTGLGNIQLAENQLYLAAETYQRALRLVGDLPIPVAPHVHLCLARISYEWNDLGAAQQHGQQSFQLGRPYQDFSDILVACQVFLARLKLAQGDAAGAAAVLAEADQSARQHNFTYQIPLVAAERVRTLLRQGPLLRQGDVAAAANLAQAHNLPLSQARVHLAQEDPAAALAVLEPWRQEVEAKDWKDERLQVILLQAVAHQAHGDKEQAVQLLVDALAMAEPGGFIRIFVDEGRPMARLLREALNLGITPEYVGRLLAAFPTDEPMRANTLAVQAGQSELVEPLSERELEVLQLIAAGLTNREIADRLYLSLNTIKVHASNIYGKLGVNNRTQAVARARDLGLLPRS